LISDLSHQQDTIRSRETMDTGPVCRIVYFPAFTGTNLYCLVTEARGCEQLAQSSYLIVTRLGIERVTMDNTSDLEIQ